MSYYTGIKRQTEETLCEVLNNGLKPTVETRTCELLQNATLDDKDEEQLESLNGAALKGQVPARVSSYKTENWLDRLEAKYDGQDGWHLRENLLIFYPSKGDEERELPFGVVHVESAKPTLGGRDPRGYLCDVRIIFVSHIDEVGSEEHSEAVSKVEDVLSLIPNNVITSQTGGLNNTHITINGLFISDMQTASQDQSHGDVFFVTVGVSKCVS